MAVDGGNARVPHHLDDGEQVTRIARALRDVRRAGVPDVEELRHRADGRWDVTVPIETKKFYAAKERTT